MSKVLIAKITSPHGIKGDAKIISYCEKDQDIFTFKNIFDEKNNNFKLKKIGKLSNGFIIVNINDINDRNKVQLLANTNLYVDSSEFPNLKSNDEFYINELIGSTVINSKNNDEKGVVLDIVNYGAKDIIEIEWQDKTIETIPFIDDYIKQVDTNNKVIFVNKPEYI